MINPSILLSAKVANGNDFIRSDLLVENIHPPVMVCGVILAPSTRSLINSYAVIDPIVHKRWIRNAEKSAQLRTVIIYLHFSSPVFSAAPAYAPHRKHTFPSSYCPPQQTLLHAPELFQPYYTAPIAGRPAFHTPG